MLTYDTPSSNIVHSRPSKSWRPLTWTGSKLARSTSVYVLPLNNHHHRHLLSANGAVSDSLIHQQKICADLDHGRSIRWWRHSRRRQPNDNRELHRAFRLLYTIRSRKTERLTSLIRVRKGQSCDRQADLRPRPHLLLSIWLGGRYASRRRRRAHGAAAIYVRAELCASPLLPSRSRFLIFL